MAQSRVYNPFVAGSGGGGGEANTGANIGSGSGVFSSKSGVTLQFKSLVAGAGVNLTPSGTEIEISATGSSVTDNLEYRELTALEISNKSLTLLNTPLAASLVAVDAIGGGAQDYGIDFTVTGNILSWNGLALDGLLEAGDKLRIKYNS
jgi:hypothetical protein